VTIPSPDLAECATEPIRVPGSIQPHGWLAVHDVASGRLVAYSENCTQLTGPAPGAAQAVAMQAVADELRTRTPADPAEGAPVSIGTTTIGARIFDATRSFAGPLALLELEPASTQCGTQGWMYSLARRFVQLLQNATSVLELAALTSAEMKRITGFGRCLVYSFDADGHGTVLAERRDEGYDSFLGHRFPASDVPAQARALYQLNHFRLIPDANYVASRLHFVDSPWSAGTLDLSFAQLRSVSPVHLEYMRNMGTLASLSVSIVVRGRLWGLVSCHNHAPRGLDLETRFACEHLGRLLSLQIEAKEDNAAVELSHEFRSQTMQLVSRLGESDATLRGMVNEPSLLRVAQADGAAVVFNDQCWHVGATPADEHIVAIAGWMFARGGESFASDDLHAAAVPFASELANTAGILAISLSQVHRHVVLWFRPELIRSVRWAGNASKQADVQGRPHPRRSFKSWEELLRGRSAPWTTSEISAVSELRQSLLGIVLHRVEERDAAAGRLGRVTLAKELAEQADLAKTHFLAVLSHELRTPLASIANAAELLERGAVIPPKLSGLVPMIKRNVAVETRLIDDLLDLSAVSAGKLQLSLERVDMDTLVDQVVQMLRQEMVAKDLKMTVQPASSRDSVMADPVRMQQVLWNIVRNAVKFTPIGGAIRVECSSDEKDFILTCTDSGVGIEPDDLSRIFIAYEQATAETHQRFGGLGLGLAIAKGIVESHGGRLEATSHGHGTGATFTLRLPLQRA
jgi:chemotaxis family two-component system sensor kinase Cph1